MLAYSIVMDSLRFKSNHKFNLMSVNKEEDNEEEVEMK